jgi:hypothetical protein
VSDFLTLLHASRQAYRAGALDLAAELAERAARELRAGSGAPHELPWSSTPADPRFPEYVRRGIQFLESFENARGALTAGAAQALAHGVYPEQPRTVGPAFYRPGLIERLRDAEPLTVRLTPKGRACLRQLRAWRDRLRQRYVWHEGPPSRVRKKGETPRSRVERASDA